MASEIALKILESKRPELETLCREYSVRKIELFGSASSDEFDPQNSDFDFLIDFGPPPPNIDLFHQYLDFKEKVESLYQRKVDLVELKAVRNAYFLRAIKPHRQVLYAA